MASESVAQDVAVTLLQLPDPCLLAVLRCCDTRSKCSAASAHSRLHEAAAAALTSITLDASRRSKVLSRQPRLDSLVDSTSHGMVSMWTVSALEQVNCGSCQQPLQSSLA